MSADNLLAVLRTPKKSGRGYEWRMAGMGLSSRPYDWRHIEGGGDQAFEAVITVWKDFAAEFADSKVYRSRRAVDAVLAAEADSYRESGIENLEIAMPFEDIVETAKTKRRYYGRRHRSCWETWAIRYEPKKRRFRFGGRTYSLSEVGLALSWAIMNGRKVLFRYVVKNSTQTLSDAPVEVTTGYVTAMLEFVGKHGWFWDEIGDLDSDHKFDPERITPGVHWDEVQSLELSQRTARARADAREKTHAADDALVIGYRALDKSLLEQQERLLRADLDGK